MRTTCLLSLGVASLLSLAALADAGPLTINFDNLADGEALATQYAGVRFSNALVLTAGVSLNELEFPPSSGLNVASDDGGPMSLAFDSRISSFSAHFTYLAPLTLSAYDANGSLLAAVFSTFSSNMALSGDPGSIPGELLQVASMGGFTKLVIEGDPLGGTFAMDDVAATPVPEPGGTLSLFAVGGAGLFILRRSGRQRPLGTSK